MGRYELRRGRSLPYGVSSPYCNFTYLIANVLRNLLMTNLLTGLLPLRTGNAANDVLTEKTAIHYIFTTRFSAWNLVR